jgi:isopropylmalate/homocitrate/citramalate synthase
VARALGISLDENLKLISETVKYLVDHGKEVIYDAEHFFDGYAANPEYALRTLEAAQSPARRCCASAIPTAAPSRSGWWTPWPRSASASTA